MLRLEMKATLFLIALAFTHEISKSLWCRNSQIIERSISGHYWTFAEGSQNVFSFFNKTEDRYLQSKLEQKNTNKIPPSESADENEYQNTHEDNPASTTSSDHGYDSFTSESENTVVGNSQNVMSSREYFCNDKDVNISAQSTICNRKRLSDFSIDYILGIKKRKNANQESSQSYLHESNPKSVVSVQQNHPRQTNVSHDNSRPVEHEIPADIKVDNADKLYRLTCREALQLCDQMHPHLRKRTDHASFDTSRPYSIPRSINPNHHCDNNAIRHLEIKAQQYLNRHYHSIFYGDQSGQILLTQHPLQIPTVHMQNRAIMQSAAHINNNIVRPSIYRNQFVYLPFPC